MGHDLFMMLYGILDPFTCFWLGMRQRLARQQRARMKQVDLPEHGVLTIAASLDFIGDSCLRTNLLTKKALDQAVAGDVLEFVSDNLSSVETIPFMLVNYDCVHLATHQEQQCWKIYVQKCKP